MTEESDKPAEWGLITDKQLMGRLEKVTSRLGLGKTDKLADRKHTGQMIQLIGGTGNRYISRLHGDRFETDKPTDCGQTGKRNG